MAQYITITSSKVPTQKLPEVEKYLANTLPKFRQTPGIISITHVNGEVKDGLVEEWTVVTWKNKEAVMAYRNSPLMQEILAYERTLPFETTRRGGTVVATY